MPWDPWEGHGSCDCCGKEVTTGRDLVCEDPFMACKECSETEAWTQVPALRKRIAELEKDLADCETVRRNATKSEVGLIAQLAHAREVCQRVIDHGFLVPTLELFEAVQAVAEGRD